MAAEEISFIYSEMLQTTGLVRIEVNSFAVESVEVLIAMGTGYSTNNSLLYS